MALFLTQPDDDVKMVSLHNDVTADLLKVRLENVIPAYSVWENSEINILNKRLRSLKDDKTMFEQYKESVRYEDGFNKTFMSLSTLIKIFSSDKQIDPKKEQYIWVPKPHTHLSGDLVDFLKWLVLRTNESLEEVDYEDFFDKFSNDYMIETKTPHDSGISREQEWPQSGEGFDFRQLDDKGVTMLCGL